MTVSRQIAVADIALESAYDFYDDFSGTAAGPLSGRHPIIGANNWQATGAGVAGAYAGAGNYGSTSGAGTTYAVMQLSAAPWEVGGVFESTSGTFTPTIAVPKDYTNHAFTAMWHANLNVASGLFTPGYWNDTWNGAGSALVNVQAAWAVPANVATYALSANTKYRYRIFFNAPYVDYVIETMAGVPVATSRTYEPNTANVIGPWVFFEVGEATTIWHEAYARIKPVLPSLRLARQYGGVEATPIGNNNPASGNFSTLQVGLKTQTPVGVFSVAYTGTDADAPTVNNTTAVGAFKVRSGTSGFAAELQVINGAGSVAKFQLDGAFATNIIGNDGTTQLGFAANSGVPIFKSGSIRFGGSSGPLLVSGTGSPEAVKTAPVGSFYLRTDGGAATTFYVKESGAGNTGWIAK